MTLPQLPWRRALVIGLGRSGQAAAQLLLTCGTAVRGYDRRAEVPGLPEGIEPVLGADTPPDTAFRGIDLLLLSPGVDPRPHRARLAALAPNTAVEGEMSLALRVAELAWGHLPTVLVTGTNGKSTVTALTGALLEAGGHATFCGGNLGEPLSERLLAVASGDGPVPAAMVLECSSYQLETMDAAPTDVAMVLNVTPDHLDRYADLEDYARTKARIFDGLDASGLALLSARDEWTAVLRPERPRVVLVDGDGPPHLGEKGELQLEADEAYPREALRLAGRHNAINALFALAAARHLGVSPQQCRAGLEGFAGLDHRMVLVAEREGIAYYDDSKATNAAAVVAGLDGFERPFVLIAGGQAKGDDLSPLRAILAARGRGLVAIGQDRQLFLDLADGVVPTAAAADMDEAVRLATEMAGVGDAVLLSPACASWDMYASYAERGRMFAAAVRALDA